MCRLRAFAFAAAILCGLLLLAGCSKSSQQPMDAGAGLIFKDGLGRQVRLWGVPERVISLAPNVTEILFAIGAGIRVVGASTNSNYPAQVEGVAKVGEEMNPSLERIVMLKPDVIFTAYSINRRETVEELERLLGPVVFVTKEMNLSGLYNTILSAGEVLELADGAAAVVAGMKARFERVKAASSALPRPRLLLAIWLNPLFAAGAGTFMDEIIRIAGAQNAAQASSAASVQLSEEALVRMAPDVIVAAAHGKTPDAGPLLRLDSIPAVRNRRVHFIDPDLLLRPGPRLAEGAEALARAAHPEIQ